MSATLGSVLDEIGVSRALAAHRLEAALPRAGMGEPRPWFVATVVAAVLWVGAMFFASFLAAMRVGDHPALLGLLGMGLFVLGGVGSRLRHGLLRLHVSLICYAGASSLLVMFGDKGLGFSDNGLIAFAAAVQLGCLVWFDSRPVRFKSTVGFSLALLAYTLDHHTDLALEALLLFLASSLTLLWLEEARLSAGPLARAVRPVGFALALCVTGLGGLTLLAARDVTLQHPLPVTVALGALLLAVVRRATRESNARLRSGAVVLSLVAVAVVVPLASDAPALLLAVLMMALGRLRKEPLLDAFGVVALGLFLTWVYLNVELSLLYTSFALAGAGAFALGARSLLLWREADAPRSPLVGSVLSPVGPRARASSWPVLVPSALVAALVLGLVAHKEAQLAGGQTVLLRLAPVDPRSLLQGDYMRLSYDLAREVGRPGREGVVRVRLDADAVAQAVVAPENALSSDVTLRWRRTRDQVVFGADSYFFAEGKGDAMAAARFAEVRVTPDGTPVLVRLLDEARVALEP